MGITIFSLFETCRACETTEDPSAGLLLHLDTDGICSECQKTIVDTVSDFHAPQSVNKDNWENRLEEYLEALR